MPANRFRKAIELVARAATTGSFRIALIGGFALPFPGVQRATGDVDFLVDEEGGDALDAALLGAGAERLHRSPDAASYARGSSELCAVDLLYARRPLAREMLRRASSHALEGGGEIAVADLVDQDDVRPTPPVRSLDEFLDFLAEIEDLFGPIEKPGPGIRGDRFLL